MTLNGFDRRLEHLEQAQFEAQLRRLQSLTYEEHVAQFEEDYGPEALVWLDAHLDGLNEAEGQALLAEHAAFDKNLHARPGPVQRKLLRAWHRWLEQHP